MLGNSWDLIEYLKQRAKSPVPFQHFYDWLMVYKLGDRTENCFKPEDYKGCVAVNRSGSLRLIISDPDMVQDLFTTKNKILEKHGTYELIF